MKKFILSVICTLLISFSVSAQVGKDSLMKLLVKETCDEIAKKDLSGKTMEEIQMELGMAMVPIVTKYAEELQAVFGVGLDDEQGSEVIGKEIGLKLVKDCPAFLKLIMNNPSVMNKFKEKDIEVKPEDRYVSGTLVKIVTGDFSYIQVKDANGKVEKLWWMEYFEGSNSLATEPQKKLNKTVKVYFVEKEMYNATLKDYMKMKVITGVE